jgi:hypothetical protein
LGILGYLAAPGAFEIKRTILANPTVELVIVSDYDVFVNHRLEF